MTEEVTLPPGVSKEQAEEILKEQPVIFTEADTGYLKKVRVWKNFYKGHEILCIQQFYKEDENQEEWQFGRAVPFPDEAIDTIMEGLTKMKTYLEGGN